MRRTWILLVAVAVALVVLPLGQAGTATPYLYWSFEAVVPSSNHPDAVSCPSTSLCLVVDGAGDVFASADASSGDPTWSGAHVDAANSVAAISCPTASFCAAVDSAGNVVGSTNPGGGASAWTVIPAGTSPLTGISCVSAIFCAAVDQAGDVLVSIDPLSSSGWSNIAHVDGTTALNGISCPTTTLCVAVDGAGNILTSTNPTAGSWQSAYVETTANDILSVTCPSASLCLAGAPDEIWTATNPAGGVGAWTHQPAGTISSLSCPTTEFCTGVDTAGNYWWSGAPTASPSGGRRGINPGALSGISCPSTTLCVAVAPSGLYGASEGYALAGIQAPTVTTGTAAIGPTATTATLTGTVNPNGALISRCVFAYGTTTSYSHIVPCAQSPGEGTGDVPVSVDISGLSPDTTYHFQLQALNYNVGKLGSDATFDTTEYPLTVINRGTGSGIVKSVPIGITCGSECSHDFPAGTSVTLTSVPSVGSRFTGWVGYCAGGGTCKVSMSSAQKITATFAKIECVVPKLTGKTLSVAKRDLSKAHCRPGGVTMKYSPTVKKGRLISQRPAPGRKLANRAKVTLVVSKGKRP
jgi:hypothetical protein